MTTAATNELTPRSVGVILSSMVGTLFSAQVMAMTVLAVFMARIAADYGWSRAAIGGAITALSAGVAVSCPCFGPVVDRLGPRRVLLPLVLVQGLLVASLTLVGRHLALFYAAYFLLGLSAPGAVAYSKLISAWFFRRRAIALTGLAVGVYASRVVGAPVAKRLMDTLGWQRVGCRVSKDVGSDPFSRKGRYLLGCRFDVVAESESKSRSGERLAVPIHEHRFIRLTRSTAQQG